MGLLVASRPPRLWLALTVKVQPPKSRRPREGRSQRNSALPTFIPPQLSQPAEKPSSGPQSLLEIKLDGYRTGIPRANKGGFRLQRRASARRKHCRRPQADSQGKSANQSRQDII